MFMESLFHFFHPKPVTLTFYVNNLSKMFLEQQPPSFELHSETTTVGELQACIRENKEYTEYPHKFPHVLLINDKRLLLEEFMQLPPANNLYAYLKKQGFKPSETNPNEGSVTFAVCNYDDLHRFQHAGILCVNTKDLEIAARRLRSSEASAFRGMQQRSSGGFNPMLAIALAKARLAEEKESARGDTPADVETAWSYTPHR